MDLVHEFLDSCYSFTPICSEITFILILNRIIIDNKLAFKAKDIKEYCSENISIQYMISKYGQEAYNNINWKLSQKLKHQIFQVLIGDQNDKFIGTNKKPIIQTAKIHHA
jgi:hypothetical protein